MVILLIPPPQLIESEAPPKDPTAALRAKRARATKKEAASEAPAQRFPNM
jgi:hypothetical protein